MSSSEEAWYARGALVGLPYSTNDVRLMTKAAIAVVNRLFRRGFKYNKAKVLQIDLRSLLVNACQRRLRLFEDEPPTGAS